MTKFYCRKLLFTLFYRLRGIKQESRVFQLIEQELKRNRESQKVQNQLLHQFDRSSRISIDRKFWTLIFTLLFYANDILSKLIYNYYNLSLYFDTIRYKIHFEKIKSSLGKRLYNGRINLNQIIISAISALLRIQFQTARTQIWTEALLISKTGITNSPRFGFQAPQ